MPTRRSRAKRLSAAASSRVRRTETCTRLVLLDRGRPFGSFEDPPGRGPGLRLRGLTIPTASALAAPVQVPVSVRDDAARDRRPGRPPKHRVRPLRPSGAAPGGV